MARSVRTGHAQSATSWGRHPAASSAKIVVVNSGRESEVIADFCIWLESQGWTVQREVAFADVVAERGDERLVAEAKGVTTSPGLDVDTMYGQLLRRMSDTPGTRYAVVVPDKAVSAALRVPDAVREVLAIDVYGVSFDGTVAAH